MSAALPSGAVSHATASGALPSGAVEIVTGGGGGGDVTPPTLTFPTGTATGTTTANGSVTTNEAGGTLYRLASTNATELVATIKAASLTSAVAASGAQAVTFTGLTPATTYFTHYVHTDAAGNDSAAADAPVSFTTAGGSATLTSSALKNNTGTLQLSAAAEAFVHDVTTGALVVKKTGLTSNGTTGVIAFSDAAMAAAATYRVVWRLTATGAEGLETLTAT